MAVLFLASPTASSLTRTCAPIITSRPLSRQCNNPIGLYAISYVGCRIHAPFIPNQRGALIAKASPDVEGAPSDSSVPSSESEEENVVAIENLPLDPKLQLKLEQKTRMKLAKKIRLRRKRLVRKRHLRKKGRWPPSKMKKNKNV